MTADSSRTSVITVERMYTKYWLSLLRKRVYTCRLTDRLGMAILVDRNVKQHSNKQLFLIIGNKYDMKMMT